MCKLLTEPQKRLFLLIAHRKDNAISRERLVTLTDVSNRKVVEELRAKGHNICSSAQTTGENMKNHEDKLHD